MAIFLSPTLADNFSFNGEENPFEDEEEPPAKRLKNYDGKPSPKPGNVDIIFMQHVTGRSIAYAAVAVSVFFFFFVHTSHTGIRRSGSHFHQRPFGHVAGSLLGMTTDFYTGILSIFLKPRLVQRPKLGSMNSWHGGISMLPNVSTSTVH